MRHVSCCLQEHTSSRLLSAHVKYQSWYLPRSTEENTEKSQHNQTRSEPRTTRVQSESVGHSAVTFLTSGLWSSAKMSSCWTRPPSSRRPSVFRAISRHGPSGRDFSPRQSPPSGSLLHDAGGRCAFTSRASDTSCHSVELQTKFNAPRAKQRQDFFARPPCCGLNKKSIIQ